MAGANDLNLAQRARIALGLSQRRFARLIGVNDSVVSRWEAGGHQNGAAAALMMLIVDHPQAALDTLAGPATKKVAKSGQKRKRKRKRKPKVGRDDTPTPAADHLPDPSAMDRLAALAEEKTADEPGPASP